MAEIPPTRASLLVRLRDPQDASAWTQFVRLYAPLVYGYARKQGLQDADAADLSQEVFGALASAVGNLDYDPRRGAFRNWLFTIVRRKLSNWRRRQRGKPDAGNNPAAGNSLEQQPAPERDEADHVVERERDPGVAEVVLVAAGGGDREVQDQWEAERDWYRDKVLVGEGDELARAREQGRALSLEAAIEDALAAAAGSDPLRGGHAGGGD